MSLEASIEEMHHAERMAKLSLSYEKELKTLQDLIRELKPDCSYREYNDNLECCLDKVYYQCKDCKMGKRIRSALNSKNRIEKP